MKTPSEKPLLKVGGTELIQRVISAIEGSCLFDRTIAAVSHNTLRTREFLVSKVIEVTDTAGKGYSLDLSAVLKKLKGRVLVVPADLALLSVQAVAEIAAIRQTSPIVSVLLEKAFVEGIGFRPSVTLWFQGKECCHSGITLFDTARINDNHSEERYAIMNRLEIAANVNTAEELRLAEELLIQRA